YAHSLRLHPCQPTVHTIMVFTLIDIPLLQTFQSGVYYADGTTPKSSRAAGAAAARRFAVPTPNGCAALLAPRPLVAWTRRVLTCDADCAYTEIFRRVGSSRPVATIRDFTQASIPTRLPPGKVKAGRSTITLLG